VLASAPAAASAANRNVTLFDVTQALHVLQTNLEELLPVVATFNDNFDFVNRNQNLLGTTPPPNMAQNLGVNFATNLAVNTAVSFGSLFNTNDAVNLRAPQSPSSAASAAVAPVPVSRETLRALLVLQADLERLLPLLNALNGGTVNGSSTVTNLFGLIPGNP
jgi:hypothetical protein